MSRSTTTLILSLVLIVQSIALPLAAASETCTSSGVTYNCITESIQNRDIHPVYQNGLNGTITANNPQSAGTTWPTTFQNRPLPEGTRMSALFETPIRIFSAYNGTAQGNPSLSPCYSDGAARACWNSATPGYGSLTSTLTFPLRVNVTTLMNGASDWYYRSPIIWQPNNFSAAVVELRDGTGAFVSGHAYFAPGFFLNPTFAENDSAVIDGRLYYHFHAPLATSQTYTITEYVKTIGSASAGLPSLDIYAAPGQHVDQDGTQSFVAFPGQNAARVFVDMDAGFSMLFVLGMGAGGTMTLLRPDANSTHLTVTAPALKGSNQSNVNNVIHVLIPLRTSAALNGILSIYNCGDSDASCAFPVGSRTVYLQNVTGSIDERVAFSGTFNGAHRFLYSLQLNMTHDGSCGLVECAVASIPNYVGIGEDLKPSVFSISYANNDGTSHTEAYDWALWIESSEDFKTVPTTSSGSTHSTSSIIAVGLIIGGVVLIASGFVVAYFSVGILSPVSGALISTGAVSLVGGVAVLLQTDPDAVHTATEALGALLAAAACAGAYIVPGLAPKLVLGSACALLGAGLTGNLPALLDFILRIPEIIKNAIELVGYWVQEVLQVAAWAAQLVFPILGLLAYAYVILVPLKIVLLAVGGVIGAIETKGGDPRRSPTFKFIRDTFYLPFWSELVEDKLGLFHVKESKTKAVN